MTTFTELLTQHVGAAFAKQLAFGDFLDGRSWGVDLRQGTCQFGDDLSYPIQLLGTEATEDSTWLWAWANEASNLPPALLTSCMALRELGQRENIPELSQRSFSIDIANGHSLSMVASGIDGKSCYYRGAYDGGALFFLVRDVPDLLLQPVTTERALMTLSQVIAEIEVPHRAMAQAFLTSQEFSLAATNDGVVGERNGDRIVLSFNNLDRLKEISGNLQPRV
jgi:hypothetical protein